MRMRRDLIFILTVAAISALGRAQEIQRLDPSLDQLVAPMVATFNAAHQPMTKGERLPTCLLQPLFGLAKDPVHFLLLHDCASFRTSRLGPELCAQVINVNFPVSEFLHRLQAVPSLRVSIGKANKRIT